MTPPLAHTNEPHSKMSHDIDDGHDKTIDTATTDSKVTAESPPLGELLDSHLAILKEKEILEYEPSTSTLRIPPTPVLRTPTIPTMQLGI